MSNRSLILDKLLPAVPFDGWTEFALREAAKAAKADAAQAFPGGIRDCVDYFHAQCDAALTHAFPEGTLAKKRMPERIEALVLARLAYLLAHREAVKRLVAYQAMPWHAPAALAALYRSVDLMWRLAGDNATDFSYYTKRMTLAALTSSTLLFWLSDDSAAQEDTHAFLLRRLQNIADFGRWKKERTKKPA